QALDVADRGIALEFANVRKPVGAVAMREAGKELLQDFASVGDQSIVDLDILVDFGAIDFYVNLARVSCICAQVTGDAIVKPHSNGNEEIGLLNRVIDPSLAVHAHHAEIERVGGGETTDAEKCHRDGEVAATHKLRERTHRAGDHDSV